jgi:hypothetical protein
VFVRSIRGLKSSKRTIAVFVLLAHVLALGPNFRSRGKEVTYEQGESFLELGDLFFGERVGLRLSQCQQFTLIPSVYLAGAAEMAGLQCVIELLTMVGVGFGQRVRRFRGLSSVRIKAVSESQTDRGGSGRCCLYIEIGHRRTAGHDSLGRSVSWVILARRNVFPKTALAHSKVTHLCVDSPH